MFFRMTPKQPGRRYGPPPAARPAGQAAVTTPAAREAAYRHQTGRRLTLVPSGYLNLTTPQAYARLNGLTPRQRRRSWHKHNRLTGLAATANQGRAAG